MKHPGLLEAVETFQRWVLVVAVVAIPLTMDLGNVEDTYYGAKAHTLLVVLITLTLCVLVRAAGGAAPPRSALSVPAALFVLAAVLATTESVDPRWSLLGSPLRHEGLQAFAAYGVIGLLIASDMRGRWTGRLLTGLVLAGCLVATYAVAQDLGFEIIARDERRIGLRDAFATLGNPNWLGAYMVMTAPIVMGLWLDAARPAARVGLAVATALTYWALLTSYSFSGWLVGWLVLAGLSWLVFAYHPHARRRLAWGLALLAVVTGLFFALPKPPVDQGATLRYQAAAAADFGSSSWGPRFFVWVRTVPLIARRPVLGYGPDTFIRVFPQEWTPLHREVFGKNPVWIDRAHNDLLDHAVAIGLLGVAAYLWAIGASILSLAAAIRVGTRGLIASGCLVAVTGYFILMQAHFSNVNVTPTFWALLGVSVALSGAEGPP